MKKVKEDFVDIEMLKTEKAYDHQMSRPAKIKLYEKGETYNVGGDLALNFMERENPVAKFADEVSEDQEEEKKKEIDLNDLQTPSEPSLVSGNDSSISDTTNGQGPEATGDGQGPEETKEEGTNDNEQTEKVSEPGEQVNTDTDNNDNGDNNDNAVGSQDDGFEGISEGSDPSAVNESESN